jgi:lactate dehydrogenase-like 2-hydroxyacid dehydrogenase
VVKSSIGIETVDVEAATEMGILCCNSPTPENYLGVAEATVGLMVALFKRLRLNEAFMRQRVEGKESRLVDEKTVE